MAIAAFVAAWDVLSGDAAEVGAATIPDEIAGLYVGQKSEVDRFKQNGERCSASSRKFLSMEISQDGTVRWSGHHFFGIDCAGDQGRTVPRSCWTEGKARIISRDQTRYALETDHATTTAGPAMYTTRLIRWRCVGRQGHGASDGSFRQGHGATESPGSWGQSAGDRPCFRQGHGASGSPGSWDHPMT